MGTADANANARHQAAWRQRQKAKHQAEVDTLRNRIAELERQIDALQLAIVTKPPAPVQPVPPDEYRAGIEAFKRMTKPVVKLSPEEIAERHRAANRKWARRAYAAKKAKAAN
jgi:hypothetical protein